MQGNNNYKALVKLLQRYYAHFRRPDGSLDQEGQASLQECLDRFEKCSSIPLGEHFRRLNQGLTEIFEGNGALQQDWVTALDKGDQALEAFLSKHPEIVRFLPLRFFECMEAMGWSELDSIPPQPARVTVSSPRTYFFDSAQVRPPDDVTTFIDAVDEPAVSAFFKTLCAGDGHFSVGLEDVRQLTVMRLNNDVLDQLAAQVDAHTEFEQLRRFFIAGAVHEDPDFSGPFDLSSNNGDEDEDEDALLDCCADGGELGFESIWQQPQRNVTVESILRRDADLAACFVALLRGDWMQEWKDWYGAKNVPQTAAAAAQALPKRSQGVRKA